MKSIKDIVDDSGMFLIKEALAQGFSKYQVYDFIEKNKFECVSHGVYVSSGAWEDENYILSLRCHQGIFSHDEALYFHGLIDREPVKKTITVYTGYGTGALVRDGIKVFTVKKDLLSIGKEEIVNSYGHKVPMYDLERTICDLIRSKKWFEIQDYQTALRSYVGRKDKNLYKLMEYAKAFHVDKKIREYMEVML